MLKYPMLYLRSKFFISKEGQWSWAIDAAFGTRIQESAMKSRMENDNPQLLVDLAYGSYEQEVSTKLIPCLAGQVPNIEMCKPSETERRWSKIRLNAPALSI